MNGYGQSAGDLDIALFDSNGVDVARSTTTTETELISLSGLQAGDYVLEVYGYAGSVGTYSLGMELPESSSTFGADSLESNNSFESATSLGASDEFKFVTDLSIHSDSDVDFFSFTTLSPGAGGDGVSIQFEQADGDLDLELLDGDRNVISVSNSISDDEEVSLEGLPAGDYFVRVFGYEGAVADYALQLYPPTGDASQLYPDAFEPNDTPATAKLLLEQNYDDLTIHDAGDVDYFDFELYQYGNSSSVVSVNRSDFGGGNGELTLSVVAEDGTVIFPETTSDDGFLSVILDGFESGTYTATITADSPLAYDLDIVVPQLVFSDYLEPNDGLATATDLRVLEGNFFDSFLNLHLTETNGIDEDYFDFTILAAGRNDSYVETRFQHSQSNIALTLLDGSGAEVATSDTSNNVERISLAGLPAGDYTVHVSGSETADYTLEINAPYRESGYSIDVDFGNESFSESQRATFQQAADRWAEVITGDLPDAIAPDGTLVDDIRINAEIADLGGAFGRLAEAGPTSFRRGTALPITGIMRFDSNDLQRLEDNGQLLPVVLHEMGHAFGLGTLWGHFNLVNIDDPNDPVYVGTNAVREFQTLSGLDTNVPVANEGGPGTIGAHWRETTFGDELNTGVLTGTFNPLSRMTVGALEDIGYEVDYSRANDFVLPGASLVDGEGEDDHLHFESDVIMGNPSADNTRVPIVAPLSSIFVPDVLEGPIAILRESETLENLTLSGAAGDTDVFQFTLDGLGEVQHSIVVTSNATGQPINLQLETIDGEVLSRGLTNGNRISLAGYGAGTYRLVTSGNANRYGLRLERQDQIGLPELAALDIDGNGQVGARSDGLLVFETLDEASNETLENLRGPRATRTADQMRQYVEELFDALDLDGNQLRSARSDGLLAFETLDDAGLAILNDLRGPGADVSALDARTRVASLAVSAGSQASIVSESLSLQNTVAEGELIGEGEPNPAGQACRASLDCVQVLQATTVASDAEGADLELQLDYFTHDADGVQNNATTTGITVFLFYNPDEVQLYLFTVP
ncbi:MAG: pre-peptidase C-terminal domain-containing protein [Rubripirellula sp.]